MPKLLAPKICELAKKEIGTEEIDGSNCGPRVNQYKAACEGLPPDKPWPWCAAFVCFIVREAMRATGIKETPGFKRPTTTLAWGFESWSRAQDNTTSTAKPHHGDIEAGDIVCFGPYSHVGIAMGRPDKNGIVETVEGNTDQAGSREGGGVFRKHRPLSEIRSRVRFNV